MRSETVRAPLPATKNEAVALLCMNKHKPPECTRFDTMEVHPKEIRYESNH